MNKNIINPRLLEILACPVCKSNVKLQDNQFICINCGRKYCIIDEIPIMLPQKMSQDLKLTINKWNESYKRMSPEDIRKAKSDYELEDLKDILKYLDKFWIAGKGDSYLEIGCGPAFLGLEMAKKGLRIFGLDTSIEGIKIAKQVYEEKKEREGLFVCGNLLSAPFEENQFDFIYGGGVIEHFRDTERAIKELYRMLRSNGSVFNTVPYLSLSSLTYRQLWGNIPDLPILRQMTEVIHIGILKEKYMQYGYEKSFTLGKLTSMFKKAGFQNLEMGLFDCYLPLTFIRNEWAKNLCRGLAKHRYFWPMIYVNAQK